MIRIANSQAAFNAIARTLALEPSAFGFTRILRS
jgi:hypothetical protein